MSPISEKSKRKIYIVCIVALVLLCSFVTLLIRHLPAQTAEVQRVNGAYAIIIRVPDAAMAEGKAPVVKWDNANLVIDYETASGDSCHLVYDAGIIIEPENRTVGGRSIALSKITIIYFVNETGRTIKIVRTDSIPRPGVLNARLASLLLRPARVK